MLNLSKVEAYGPEGIFAYLTQIWRELDTWARRVLDLRTTTLDQLTANVNDYDVGVRSVIRVSSDASRNITGFVGIRDSRMIIVINVGSFDVVITHEDASSSANNRVITKTAGSITLTPRLSMILIYDATSLRWRQIV